MLGTGTPNPDPDRMGSGLAVIAGGRPYLVDCGTGVVRRAAAARKAGIEALAMPNLSRLFLTHLHSDHTLGCADLILTPWVLERDEPLQVFGPHGTRAMVDHLLAAYAEDIEMRLHGSQPQNATGIRVEVHEIEPGPVYQDENISVSAFAVNHGEWDEAYGFRFEAPDRSIVVSGDSAPTEAVVEAGWKRRSPDWQAYHAASHTSGVELGELAVRARPRLLVLYHQLLWMGATEEELLAEIRQGFDGEVASAKDLDMY